MSEVCLSQDFIGKPIVDENTGQIIAKVVDVLIDPNVVQVAALVTSKVEELAGSGRWLNVSDQVKGHEVVSSLGTRIGELDDVVVNAKGQLVAYVLGQVFIEGPVAESKRLPADTTQSFGQDVLTVSYAPDTVSA